MKKIAIFFLGAGLVLLIAGNISAQDAAAPFRRISPSPSPEGTPKPIASSTPKPLPTPAATPTPKPRPSPSSTPAPTSTPDAAAEKATPAPTATKPAVTPKPVRERASAEKPSRRVLEEKPVRAVEPRQPWIRRIPARKIQGPSAYKPTFDLSGSSNWATNATIRALENKWQAAVKSHDLDALERLLADDFVATSSSGRRASKARLLRELRNDRNVYRATSVRGTSVRMVSPGVAVISGTINESGTKEDGQTFTNSRRFSDTWKERKGQWVCTASTVTAIPKR